MKVMKVWISTDSLYAGYVTGVDGKTGSALGGEPVLVSRDEIAGFTPFYEPRTDLWGKETGDVDVIYATPATPAAMAKYNVPLPPGWEAKFVSMAILHAYTDGFVVTAGVFGHDEIMRVSDTPAVGGGYTLRKLPRVGWHSHYNREMRSIDDNYRPYPYIAADECMEAGYCTGWEETGSSGIASRRWIRLDGFPTIEVEAYRVAREQIYDNRGSVVSWCPETVSIPDPAAVAACKEILRKHAAAEAHREVYSWFAGDSDVVTIREYNKTLVSDYGLPEDVFPVRGRGTSRGNTTMVLVRIRGNTIRVPDSLKGLVIGKGGRNIKALEAKVGRRLKVK